MAQEGMGPKEGGDVDGSAASFEKDRSEKERAEIGLKELRDWLALGAVRGLSGHGAVGLAGRFGSPGSVIEACRDGVVPEGIRPKLARAIAGNDNFVWADKELEAAKRSGVTLLAYSDPRYPALLREIPDPPHLLYVRGERTELFSMPCVGVVGTRIATAYGRMVSEGIARDLANLGIVVVSGGARGCDSAAHKGVLKVAGATIAVLGTGVDVVYPGENGALYEEIMERGLLVSEFPMATPPAAYNFPRRNRIISGLSLGLLVAEAPVRSGALMTARLALEQNREVFAVPGSVASERSKGTNKLLKEGAALVESAVDIVEALSISIVGQALGARSGGDDYADGHEAADVEAQGTTRRAACATAALTPEEERVFNSLGTEAVQIDTIIGSTGLSVAQVSTALLGLELKGLVEQRPGKVFKKSYGS